MEIKTNTRLTEISTLRKSCEGVGWCGESQLSCLSPPPSVTEFVDFCVKSPYHTAAAITVIGVYIPCADLGMYYYSEHLVELEKVILECQ